MAVCVKWFPPSWVQIKARDTTLHIDPAYLRTYFLKHPKKIEFSRWPDPIDGLPEELEEADVILVTHDHKDHVKDVTLNRLRRPNTLVVAPQRCVKKIGGEVQVVEAGVEILFGDVRIRTVSAYNTENGRSTKKNHRKGHGVGYVIHAEDRTIYHAGDTDLIPEMAELGPIDLALLPIGGTFTMDVEEAAQAAVRIKPKTVVPIHHLKADPQELKGRLEAESDIEIRVLSIGEAYRLGS